ncbi:unnamed protein product [Camellia sinensis]
MVGYSSPAESGIMDDLGLSDAAYSVFGSILTLGALLGAVMCGKMADLLGRRGTMAFSQIFCIIGWFAIAFAEVPVYIAEITPKNLRGGFTTTVNQLLVTTGLSMTYLIGIVVHWRVLSLIGVVPCVLQLLGLHFMPESPRWRAMLGRWSQCKVALQRLRGQNANISEEAHEIRVFRKHVIYPRETLQLFPNPIFDIFRRKYAHSLIVGVGLMVLQQFGGVNAIGYYAAAIFESAGFSSTIGTIAIAVVQLFRGMFALGMGGIPWVMMSEDIPHKHESFGWKPCNSSQLVLHLGYFIYLHLPNGVELRWNIYHVRNYGSLNYSIRCKASTRDKRPNPRRNTSINELINLVEPSMAQPNMMVELSMVQPHSFTPPPLPTLLPKSVVSHPVHKTLATAANLANLLPTGTVLAFQALTPSFSNNGTCQIANMCLTTSLVGFCAIICFLSSFTDSFLGSDGKCYYGIATFKGLYVFNYNNHEGEERKSLEYLARFKINRIDFVHAFVSLFVFLVFAMSDYEVQTCLIPEVGANENALIMNLPLGAGVLSSFLFIIFPTTRRGIGDGVRLLAIFLRLIQSQARALEDNFFGGKKQIEISSSSVDEDLVIEEPSGYTNTSEDYEHRLAVVTAETKIRTVYFHNFSRFDAVDEDRQRISLGMKNSYFMSNCAKVQHPLLAEVEARASILPLEVPLDDIENSDMVNAVCQNIEHVGDLDTLDEKNKRPAKHNSKEAREQEIRAAEERLLEKDIPRSVDEFEKLVRVSPNSSFVWIKYMAFMLSLADVEKARLIAERSLKTINILEESEKLNVWVAYFNLENAYGNPREEAVSKIFQRALQYCDPKKVHLALLGMYERTEQHQLADELLSKMSKKFKHSCKVWLRRIQWLLKQNQDEVQSVVKRAVLCLPRHKHIKFLSQAAILEFKCGVPDRGRSMFEGMLRDYPKRTDEIRLGDMDVIRALFERATTLSLPAKKMKFLFKKYLEFEKSLGDEECIESVKQKAMEYVETTFA